MRKARLSYQAREDLVGIWEYVAQDNPRGDGSSATKAREAVHIIGGGSRYRAAPRRSWGATHLE